MRVLGAVFAAVLSLLSSVHADILPSFSGQSIVTANSKGVFFLKGIPKAGTTDSYLLTFTDFNPGNALTLPPFNPVWDPVSYSACVSYNEVNRIYCWGGLDIVAEAFTVPDLFIYDVATAVWSSSTLRGFTQGQGASDHRATLVNDKIYVFGGYRNISAACPYCTSTTNEILVIDPVAARDTRVSYGADGPTQRGYHCQVGIENGFVVIGGLSEPTRNAKTSLSDVWVYDVNSKAWTKKNPTSTNGTFPAVDGHVCALYKKSIYLFGGRTGERLSNAVWVLNMTTPEWEWRLAQKDGTNLEFVPAGRFEAAAASIGTHMIVHGGFLSVDRNRQDPAGVVYAYNFCNETWTRLPKDLNPAEKCPQDAANSQAESGGLKAAAIVGIVFGVLLGLTLLYLIYKYISHRRAMAALAAKKLADAETPLVSNATAAASSATASAAPTVSTPVAPAMAAPTATAMAAVPAMAATAGAASVAYSSPIQGYQTTATAAPSYMASTNAPTGYQGATGHQIVPPATSSPSMAYYTSQQPSYHF